ncbi:MAG: STM4011 family radical SAM protein [Myxococcota bacterium]|nr:STM4011 family radical SAM protein [Myxococcota bacterium]
MRLRILYRGPLASCNYTCDYCPFAKRRDTAEALAQDAKALERFCDWVAGARHDRIGLLFTPWGEALIRRHYQRALARLSRLAHVERVAIQTNLSGSMAFVEDCDLDSLALWASWHPSQIPLGDFAAKVRALRERRVRMSVGIVAVEGAEGPARALRDALPDDVYVWVNAAKRVHGPYGPEQLDHYQAIDPLFAINTVEHPSAGRACRAGEDAIAVDGEGDVRRCHFVDEVIGNLYEGDIRERLRPRACPKARCGCHIGYVHLEPLGLRRTFGAGVLERIPELPIAAPARVEPRRPD